MYKDVNMFLEAFGLGFRQGEPAIAANGLKLFLPAGVTVIKTWWTP